MDVPGAKKVCAVVGGGLGNLIETTPFLDALHGRFPGDVVVWVQPNARKFAPILDYPAESVVFTRPEAEVYALTPYATEADSQAMPRQVVSRLSMAEYSETEVCMDLLTQLGGGGKIGPPRIRCGETSPLEGEYVVLAPGVGSEFAALVKKRYRYWYWIASRLRHEGYRVVIAGVARDHELWHEEFECLCGKTDIMQVTALLKAAKCVIAIDNGLYHAAATLGTKTLVLFGPTSTRKNQTIPGPHARQLTLPASCRPCQDQHGLITGKCRKVECMEFPPHEVVMAAIELMGDPAPELIGGSL